MIREPAVAGTFYPGDNDACRRSLDECFETPAPRATVDGRIVGGLVPHAGWMCSGRVAAQVVSAIADQRTPETFVIFGAVHHLRGTSAAIFPSGRWDFPSGSIAIDARLAERIMGHTNLIAEDPYAHEPEHSIEVQVPFIQRLFPKAKLLPVMVPPSARAAEIGEAVGRTIDAYRSDAVVLASSDLTHYGRRFAFTPKGTGPEGLDWAKNVNDRRIIDRVLALDADAIVPEATRNRNACGSGAIAALIGASKILGAERGVLLDHTTSAETIGPDPANNAVGYAGIVLTTR